MATFNGKQIRDDAEIAVKSVTVNEDRSSTTPGIVAKQSNPASPDIELRYNEAISKWQYTNDGIIYSDIGGSGGGAIADYGDETADSCLAFYKFGLDSVHPGKEYVSGTSYEITVPSDARIVTVPGDLTGLQDISDIIDLGTIVPAWQLPGAMSVSVVVSFPNTFTTDTNWIAAMDDTTGYSLSENAQWKFGIDSSYYENSTPSVAIADNTSYGSPGTQWLYRLGSYYLKAWKITNNTGSDHILGSITTALRCDFTNTLDLGFYIAPDSGGLPDWGNRVSYPVKTYSGIGDIDITWDSLNYMLPDTESHWILYEGISGTVGIDKVVTVREVLSPNAGLLTNITTTRSSSVDGGTTWGAPADTDSFSHGILSTVAGITLDFSPVPQQFVCYGKPVHLLFTRNASMETKIYMNGVLIGTTTTDSPPTGGSNTTLKIYAKNKIITSLGIYPTELSDVVARRQFVETVGPLYSVAS